MPNNRLSVLNRYFKREKPSYKFPKWLVNVTVCRNGAKALKRWGFGWTDSKTTTHFIFDVKAFFVCPVLSEDFKTL